MATLLASKILMHTHKYQDTIVKSIIPYTKQGLYSPVNIVIYNVVAMMSQPCD